jgi:threonine dehydrogenase-like Zn-dependent dehydrogenase
MYATVATADSEMVNQRPACSTVSATVNPVVAPQESRNAELYLGARMKVAVIGAGYLGTTHAAGMAQLGHDVVAVDIDADKVAKLQSGVVPFFEPNSRTSCRTDWPPADCGS